jgi:integrating conjugative element protein (TIGR03761 family)
MGISEKIVVSPQNKDSSSDIGDLSDDFDEDFAEEAPSRLETHEDNADRIVQPRYVSNRPGPMHTKGSIVLHTRAAHRLFYGRRKDEKQGIKPIIGLVRFSTNVNNICELAAKDDPYADAVLVQLEKKFNTLDKLIKDNVTTCEDLLSSMDGLTIETQESVKPIVLPVEFRTTYGFMGARLLGQYDRLVRQCLSARHVGLLFSDDWGRLVGTTGRKIRELFWLSTSYRYTGVGRSDIKARTRLAQQAIDKYGELPQSIIDGTQRAQYAPMISSR